LLNQLYEEQDYFEKPEISQDKYQEINYNLLLAIKEKRRAEFKIYENKKIKVISGSISQYDHFNKRLQIINNSNKIVYIQTEKIIDIII